MPDTSLIFSADSYHFEGLSVATAVAAVITLVIGALILVRGRASRPTSVYFIITVSASAWLGAFALMYGALEPATAIFWARVAHLPAYLVPAAIFQFAVLQHTRRHQLTLISDIVWIVFAVAGMVFLRKKAPPSAEVTEEQELVRV